MKSEFVEYTTYSKLSGTRWIVSCPRTAWPIKTERRNHLSEIPRGEKAGDDRMRSECGDGATLKAKDKRIRRMPAKLAHRTQCHSPVLFGLRARARGSNFRQKPLHRKYVGIYKSTQGY